MTTFAAGDQQRLVVALTLTREQLYPNSHLNSLMNELESLDTKHSTNMVDLVLTALDQIDSINAAASEAASTKGITSESVAGEYSVTYSSGSASTSTVQADLSAQRDIILRYLDPMGILRQLSAGSRVIRTL